MKHQPKGNTRGGQSAGVGYVPSHSLTCHRINVMKSCGDRAYSLSSLSKKTRKSNHLQISLQSSVGKLPYDDCGHSSIRVTQDVSIVWNGMKPESKCLLQRMFCFQYTMFTILFYFCSPFLSLLLA